jgi:hypothetical protein
VIWKTSLTNIIFPICVHISRLHFKKSKSSRGSYLHLELTILVKIFEIYLVTQSLCPFKVEKGGGSGGSSFADRISQIIYRKIVLQLVSLFFLFSAKC